MRKEFRSLISLEDALSLVLSHLPASRVEEVTLEESLGRVLAEKVVSDIDVPGFDRASMDGYAVMAGDVALAREDRPVSLKLVGSVRMGRSTDITIGPGEAAEVSTGSVMPRGADAVVMVEHSEASARELLVMRPLHPSENVLRRGSDISFGDGVLLPGIKITPREIGVLAAVGRRMVRVRSLKVAIASTGDELVAPGSPLAPGQVYDINSYTVAAAVSENGGTPVRYGILPDNRATMDATIFKMAGECDMIIVSGSTSAGAGDMVYRVLDEVGETLFHGINLKPGKPTLFGSISGKPFLGLPGYPVSALTVFGLLAAPVIRGALGLKPQGQNVRGKLAAPVRSEGRHQMLAVGVARGRVHPVDRGSGSITTLSRADGFVEIPQEVEYIPAGEEVSVHLFGEISEPDLAVAGEPSAVFERVLVSLPFDIRYNPSGSAGGVAAVEDRVADVALVLCTAEPLEGSVIAGGFSRDLGFMAREGKDLDNLAGRTIVGWRRESEMSRILARLLKEKDLPAVYEVTVRSHSAAASAVSSGRADIAFGERSAAGNSGLAFKPVLREDLHLVARPEALDLPAAQALIEALKSLWSI